MIRLAAVQAHWGAAGYATPDAFRAQVDEAVRRAVADAAGPTLVAFPELFALPLLFTAAGHATALERPLLQALAALLPGRMRRLGWSLLRGRPPLQALLGEVGVAAYRLWFEAMHDAARTHRATVVAGSGLFPGIGYEAARGWHAFDPRVRNVALLFAPNGALIARAAKAFFTPGLERRIGLAPGPLEGLPVVATPVGRVGVAICLDGWFHPVLERLDGLGAQILVQPSANAASWSRRWPPDPRLTEGEAWLARGLGAGLRGRYRLRYGVNPMLVGGIAPLHFEGRSTLWRASLDSDERPELLAIAAASDAPTVIWAEVPHPRARADESAW
jgi:predicted amidohydrolase